MIKFIFGLIIIAAGFVLTIFRDPVWGLYLFAVFTHVPLTQLGESIALPLRIPIVAASLTVVSYLTSAQYPSKFSRWPMETWLLGLMVLGMCLSSAVADFNPDLSWKHTFTYFKYWVFFVLMLQMLNSLEKIEWFHRVMILSAAWLVYRCWDLRGTTGARFENFGGSVVSDANHYAAALVLLFPLVFLKTMSKNRLVALGAALGCFGVVMSIFISGSRGGFLGLLTAAIFLFFSFKAQRRKILIACLLIGLAAWPFVNEDQRERLSTLFSATNVEERDGSAQSRVEFWRLSIDLFREHPLAGVGIGNFGYYSGPLLEGLPDGAPGHVAHSLWCEILAEGGLVVSLPFFLILLRYFWKTRQLLRRCAEQGLAEHFAHLTVERVGLAAFLVCATFLNRLIYEPIYWFVALSLAHGHLQHQAALLAPAPRCQPCMPQGQEA